MYCIFHDVCFIATTFSLFALRLMNETQVTFNRLEPGLPVSKARHFLVIFFTFKSNVLMHRA